MAESYIPNPIGFTNSTIAIKSVGGTGTRDILLLDFPYLKIAYINGSVSIITAMTPGASSEALATMPSHIRPSYGQHILCNRTDSGSAACNLYVNTSGNVHIVPLQAVPSGVLVFASGWIYYG